VAVLIRNANGAADINRFPTPVPGDPLANMVVGILEYASLALVVPIALLLLFRSGEPPSSLGLGKPSFRADVWPGLGLAAAAFGSAVLLLIPFSPLLRHHNNIAVAPVIGHPPKYYVIYALAISAATAVTEEVV